MRKAAILVAGLIVLAFGMPARAVQLGADECQVMAIWARDMGADREKVKGHIQQQKAETPFFEVLERIFKELWETQADRTDVMKAVYMDCVRRRGQYGTDT